MTPDSGSGTPASGPGCRSGSPMTPEQAEWVRANVWPAGWLRNYQHCPWPFIRCACQQGKSWDCMRTAHSSCAGEYPPQNESVIAADVVPHRHARLPEPYEHDAGGLRAGHADLAFVWLADRRCRHRCTCPCHTDPEFLHPLRGPQLAFALPESTTDREHHHAHP
ncbi:DUF6248 family natural product biosynthesis protein [Streptacidiphilus cavernicola]|uniref:DUF6248 family natural product biosynthesis protein n=1 Tax=Streptacidiphilus cavernicola TaxID=3342716 RepID=A0ABV6W243_9ACTN